jgi:hypothetical protein
MKDADVEKAIAEISLAVSSDQILLRALLCIAIEALCELSGTKNQRAVSRELIGRLTSYVDGYHASPENENVELERARELARMEIDRVASLLRLPDD